MALARFSHNRTGDPIVSTYKPRLSAFLGACALALALALPTLPARAEPTRGGTLRVLIEQEPTALLSIATTAGATRRVSAKVTEGLLTYDLDFKPQPQLATAWTVGADGLTYEFKLRPGVKWHDGKDFTSEDVAFSIKTLKELHPRGRSTFANVVEVATPDPLTVVIRLSKPAPYLLLALAGSESPIIPKHVFAGADVLSNKALSAPIGTGPFKFKEWSKGSHIIYERNPDYWAAGKPFVDRLVIRFIPDPAARSAAIEAGEIDLAVGSPVPRVDLARLKDNPALAIDDRGYAYNGNHTQLYFNYENPVFKDKRVREAIAHAIDTRALLEIVFLDYGILAPAAISPNLPEFSNPDVKPYAFDPALANKLLDEAGLPRKADGTRFSLRLRANPYHPQATGDFVKQSLAALGIAVDYQYYDLSTYVQKIYTGRDFDLTLEWLANSFDPTIGIQRTIWSKNFKIGLPFSNPSHYENADIDRLLEAAAVEVDRGTRRKLWFEIQQRLHDDVAALYLLSPHGISVFKKKVKDHTLGVNAPDEGYADVYIEK
jgi:peptide/nickel transport system substrate-binding protein